jgi:sec-independent protein translocase protein TatB
VFNIGPGELIAISMVALIVLGPQRLPQAVRTVGRVVGELRRISSGFQDELRTALDDSELEEIAARRSAQQPPSLPPLSQTEPSSTQTDDEPPVPSTVEPVDGAEPVDGPEPVEPDGLGESVDRAEPDEPLTVAEPAEPAERGESVDRAEPDEPSPVAEPDDPPPAGSLPY